MKRTKETILANELAGQQSRLAAAQEPDQLAHEDLSPERVRQSVIYTRQDVILLYSMLSDTHDQLVRIKRRLGIGIIVLAMVILLATCDGSGY